VSGNDPKSHQLSQAHAEAYRAYLRALRDNLAKVDIEAVDVSRPVAQIPPVVNSYYTYFTYHTYYTYHTFHTYGTQATQATIATESSIQ